MEVPDRRGGYNQGVGIYRRIFRQWNEFQRKQMRGWLLLQKLLKESSRVACGIVSEDTGWAKKVVKHDEKHESESHERCQRSLYEQDISGVGKNKRNHSRYGFKFSFLAQESKGWLDYFVVFRI